MKLLIGILTTILLITCFSACGEEKSVDDIDQDRVCGTTHEAVGTSAALTEEHHNVSGTIHILDDCTLEIRDFYYDGGGINVQVVAEKNGDFGMGTALSKDLYGTEYKGETLKFKLPENFTLDDASQISIWCNTAADSFGHADFSK